jgi:hypothetical protein
VVLILIKPIGLFGTVHDDVISLLLCAGYHRNQRRFRADAFSSGSGFE